MNIYDLMHFAVSVGICEHISVCASVLTINIWFVSPRANIWEVGYVTQMRLEINDS